MPQESSYSYCFTGIGNIAINISTATVCGLSIGDKVIYDVITIHTKKQYEKHQQTIKSFDKLNRKSLQDNVNE